ncbi:MAG: hypothetical protein ABW095_03880 [Candidatus Thiodiazotropha sp.]
MHHRSVHLLICLMMLSPAAASLADVRTPFTLHLTPSLSNDGKASLSWSLEGDAEAQIEQDIDPGFTEPRNLYQGSDLASVITGLPDGAYHYRGRLLYPDGSASAWSEPVTLEVHHHSLLRAGFFFSVGALVFLATTALILIGNRRQGASDE